MPGSRPQRALDLAPPPPTPVIELGGRNRERAIVDRVEDALAVGVAVTGLHAVTGELERRTVELLIVPERSRMARAAIDRAIDEAAAQGVRVFIVRVETPWLAEHGEIVALLKRL
jgi:stalled ribosome rescue protein Dom34